MIGGIRYTHAASLQLMSHFRRSFTSRFADRAGHSSRGPRASAGSGGARAARVLDAGEQVDGLPADVVHVAKDVRLAELLTRRAGGAGTGGSH
jgi:ABC-type sulfate transport system substrate-binding protein